MSISEGTIRLSRSISRYTHEMGSLFRQMSTLQLTDLLTVGDDTVHLLSGKTFDVKSHLSTHGELNSSVGALGQEGFVLSSNLNDTNYTCDLVFLNQAGKHMDTAAVPRLVKRLVSTHKGFFYTLSLNDNSEYVVSGYRNDIELWSTVVSASVGVPTDISVLSGHTVAIVTNTGRIVTYKAFDGALVDTQTSINTDANYVSVVSYKDLWFFTLDAANGHLDAWIVDKDVSVGQDDTFDLSANTQLNGYSFLAETAQGVFVASSLGVITLLSPEGLADSNITGWDIVWEVDLDDTIVDIVADYQSVLYVAFEGGIVRLNAREGRINLELTTNDPWEHKVCCLSPGALFGG